MAFIFAFLISIVAAIVPTAVYSFAFYWADRYEREPRSLLTVAFVWGAVPAIIVSLIAELALGTPLAGQSGTLQAALITGVVLAPVIEEIAKGAALLGLYHWRHSEFDGVLDGLIYGALVGFGFAMTENFLYFLGAFGEAGFAGLSWVIFLRAIVFGLNHAFYTSLTGIGFGLARNERNPVARIAFVGVGLVSAILVHSLHNLGVITADVTPIGILLSLAIAAGGLALVIAAVVLSWKHERSVMQAELSEELGSVLSAQELITLTGRWRQPIRPRPGDGAERMALFAELAVRKRRLRVLGFAHSSDILDEIEEIRARLRETKTGPQHASDPVDRSDA